MNPNTYTLVKTRIKVAGTNGTNIECIMRGLESQSHPIIEADIYAVIADLDQQGLIVRDAGKIWWKHNPRPAKLPTEQRRELVVEFLSRHPRGLTFKELISMIEGMKKINGLFNETDIRNDLRYLGGVDTVVPVGSTRGIRYFHSKHAPAPDKSSPPPPPAPSRAAATRRAHTTAEVRLKFLLEQIVRDLRDRANDIERFIRTNLP